MVSRTGSVLAAESVQGPALPLQSVDNVHGSDSLPLGMLSVGDGVADDILEEHLHVHKSHTCITRHNLKDIYLQDTSGLFIDETADPLDSSSSCQSSNGRLGDALNNTSLAG